MGSSYISATVRERTVIYRSLNAFGFVVLDEGREFVTLNTYVSGSDKSEADSNLTLRAAEITGQDKFKVESANILGKIEVGQSLSASVAVKTGD
jgi:hypothetical protein